MSIDNEGGPKPLAEQRQEKEEMAERLRAASERIRSFAGILTEQAGDTGHIFLPPEVRMNLQAWSEEHEELITFTEQVVGLHRDGTIMVNEADLEDIEACAQKAKECGIPVGEDHAHQT